LRPLTPRLNRPGGQLIRTLTGHSSSVISVAVTLDGKRVISGSSDSTLKVWNLEPNKEPLTLTGHGGWVNAVAVTPNGKRAISGSSDSTLKVWDLERNKELFTLTGHNSSVTAVAITPNGKWVISGSYGNTIKVWSLEKRKLLFTLKEHSSWVSAVAITLNGKQLISSSYDNTLKVWNLETEGGFFTFIWNLIPDDKPWNLISRRQRFTLTGHSNLVTAVAVTPDSKLAISGSWDNTLKVWNLEKRELMFPPLTGHNSGVMSVAVTPDGKQVISASTDNTLKVWNLEIAESPLPFPEHSNSVRVVAVTPDGKRVISGAGDKTLKVWNLQTRELLQVWNLKTEKSAYSSFTDYSSSVTAATVSPDGKKLISGSADKNLKVWNLQTAEELVNLKSPYKYYFEALASLLYGIIVLTWVAIFFAPIDRVTSFLMFITSVASIVILGILIDNIDRHLVSAVVVISEGNKVI